MNQDPGSPSRRTVANRSNAQKSTGPRTEAGKASSKLNALKSALTGRTVLLPTDDMERYEHHMNAWAAELKPVTARESALVQAIADSHWRTERILRLEFALYAQGRLQFGEEVRAAAAASGITSTTKPGNPDASLENDLIDARTYLAFEKQLRNLAIQEARLRRQREKDMQELTALQKERRNRYAALPEWERLDTAARLYEAARDADRPFDPAAHGFEFSLREIQTRLFFLNPGEIPEPGSNARRSHAASQKQSKITQSVRTEGQSHDCEIG